MYKCILFFCLISNDERSTVAAYADTHHLYTRVECLNLNANIRNAAAVVFHPRPVGKTHAHINL